MCNRNSVGLRMEPWGTPTLTWSERCIAWLKYSVANFIKTIKKDFWKIYCQKYLLYIKKTISKTLKIFIYK